MSTWNMSTQSTDSFLYWLDEICRILRLMHKTDELDKYGDINFWRDKYSRYFNSPAVAVEQIVSGGT